MTNVAKTSIHGWPVQAGVFDISQSWVRRNGTLTRLQTALDDLGNDGTGEFDSVTIGTTALTELAAGRIAANGVELAFQRFFDVKSPAYGALGDNSNDDTAEIQAALTAAESAGGGVVVIPPGTYLVTQLVLPSYVWIVGLLPDKCIIKSKSGANTDLIVSKTYVNNETYVDIGNAVIGVTLDGNKANNTSGSGLIHRTYNIKIADVIVQNAYANGIVQSAVTANAGNGNNAAECRYINTRVKNCRGRGIYFYDNSTSKIADAYLTDCWIHGNGTDGYYQIEAQRAAGFHISGLQMYSDYAGNLKLSNAARTFIKRSQLDFYASQGTGSTTYSNLNIGACVESGVSIEGNHFHSTVTDVASSTYAHIDFSHVNARANVQGNTFYTTGLTNPIAIHRSAASAVSVNVGPTNHFVGFTAAQYGQGWADGGGYLYRSAPVTKTANFTVAAYESFLINNKSGSSCTATLPTASAYTGREITILNYQAQTVVSASSNVVPLAGGAAGTAILAATAGKYATLVSDGTNWIITAGN